MLYRFLFVFLFLSSNLLFAQQKYFVYFKDKGVVTQNRFYKTSQIISLCTQYLSEKSIERRKKVMGEDNFINYDDIPVFNSYTQQLVQSGAAVDKVLKWFNAVSCYLNAGQYDKIKALPFVEKIEPVKSLSSNRTEDNPSFNMPQISNRNIFDNLSSFNYGNSLAQNSLSDIPKVHEVGFYGTGVLIGVLDTGFELTSNAFYGIKILAQYDFVFNDDNTANQSSDIIGQHNHGTAVLSIMAGKDNGYLIGPAFGASFLLAKTEDTRSEKNVEEDNYAAALEWMEAKGVQITTSSLGYNILDAGENSYTYQNMDGKTTICTKAAEKAFERGVVTLSAAGNEAAKLWHYIIAPSDGINTIAVGALTPQNVVASFSSRGPTSDGRIKPDIAAQGTTVFHALPLSTAYSSGDGTSYATPIAAGITALLVQAYPHLNNVQVRSILLQAGDNFRSPNNDIGYGLVSAVKALNFPNLKKSNNIFELNKMFIGETNIDFNSVKLNYSINSIPQNQVGMVYSGNNKYAVSLPILNQGDKIRFTFSYNTSVGSKVEPQNENYIFTYGELLIQNSSFIASGIIPKSFILYQNYPNPFNNETMVRFDLPFDLDVSVDIFNILGQKVITLFSGYMNAGQKSLTWNGRNEGGSYCPSGVYLINVITANGLAVKKMVLLK